MLTAIFFGIVFGLLFTLFYEISFKYLFKSSWNYRMQHGKLHLLTTTLYVLLALTLAYFMLKPSVAYIGTGSIIGFLVELGISPFVRKLQFFKRVE